MSSIISSSLRFTRAFFASISSIISGLRHLPKLHDLILFQQTLELQHSHLNPLNRFGAKCFSQSDEDGITIEILNRIDGVESGVFVEFGVGDGTENNTLILAAHGWKGVWIGGQTLALDTTKIVSKKFTFIKAWITRENIIDLTSNALAQIDESSPDVISVDLDGNDLYLVDTLLIHGFKPKLFIVEYNAKFIPPIEFSVSYDPKHRWMRDDYFGASLTSFHKVFSKYGYRLICCNAHTGTNAFFVRSEYAERFHDVPDDIGQLYAPPRYHLYIKYGHKKSVKLVEQMLRGDASIDRE